MTCWQNSGIDWLEVLQWNQRHVGELRAMGWAYLEQGLYDRAESFFETLVVLCPQEAYDSQTLGALYFENGKVEASLERLNYALELDPAHLPTLFNKAKALLVSGNLEEGLKLARSLEGAADPTIAGPASALVMGYTLFQDSD